MLEGLLAAEELVIRVLDPARAQHFVGQVVHVVQDEEAGSSGGWPGPARHTALNRVSRKSQSISPASRTIGWPRSMIRSSAGRNRSFCRLSRGLPIAPSALNNHGEANHKSPRT